MSEHKIIIEHRIVFERPSLLPSGESVVALDEIESRSGRARLTRFAQVNRAVHQALVAEGVRQLTEAQFHALESLF